MYHKHVSCADEVFHRSAELLRRSTTISLKTLMPTTTESIGHIVELLHSKSKSCVGEEKT